MSQANEGYMAGFWWNLTKRLLGIAPTSTPTPRLPRIPRGSRVLTTAEGNLMSKRGRRGLDAMRNSERYLGRYFGED